VELPVHQPDYDEHRRYPETVIQLAIVKRMARVERAAPALAILGLLSPPKDVHQQHTPVLTHHPS